MKVETHLLGANDISGDGGSSGSENKVGSGQKSDENDRTDTVEATYCTGASTSGSSKSMMKPGQKKDKQIMITDDRSSGYHLEMGKVCKKSPIPCQWSIFRVPHTLRRHNEKAFEPHIVSFGPFHHRMEKLEPMQKSKLGYLNSLLERAPTNETTLDCFVEAIEKIEQECRECYEGEIGFTKKEFIEMMVVDGCFILELLRKDPNVQKKFKGLKVPRDPRDPVFLRLFTYLRIKDDMKLLENQLPWRVLDCLFNLTKSHTETMSLVELVVVCFGVPKCPINLNNLEHILDCLRCCYIGETDSTPPHPPETRITINFDHIPPVSELEKAGVQFEAIKSESMLVVTFKDGTMRIPSRSVSESVEIPFRNIVAFEQCHPRKEFKFSSYVKLMDDLINTSQDVYILKRKKILKVHSSLEDLAKIFNGLYRDVEFGDNFLYSSLYKDVNAYIGRRRNTWRAALKHDYFNNPWRSLSVMAAILILLFTFTQTLYTALAYYKGSS